MTPEEAERAIAFEDGFWAGWHARRDVADQLDDRDDRLARRIVAFLLQHGYNEALARMVTTTAPYAERGIPRQRPKSGPVGISVGPRRLQIPLRGWGRPT